MKRVILGCDADLTATGLLDVVVPLDRRFCGYVLMNAFVPEEVLGMNATGTEEAFVPVVTIGTVGFKYFCFFVLLCGED